MIFKEKLYLILLFYFVIFIPTNTKLTKEVQYWHCVKSVRIQIYSGLHFPAFWLNTKRYSVSLSIQSECGKMRITITPNTDFFHAVWHYTLPYFFPAGRTVSISRNSKLTDFQSSLSSKNNSLNSFLKYHKNKKSCLELRATSHSEEGVGRGPNSEFFLIHIFCILTKYQFAA